MIDEYGSAMLQDENIEHDWTISLILLSASYPPSSWDYFLSVLLSTLLRKSYRVYSLVKKTFQFNIKVQPIALYPHVNVPDGSKVTVTGWGRTDTSIVVEKVW
ncbi:unnamed protein product [Timema podura]|uniref:Peptidase S1 domain-containing protein n=1 Tax=Timema podura TaxID=61482 RepID=A0ABN7NW57_TIMPD|nr:unnamed protein product [Timema podura]